MRGRRPVAWGPGPGRLEDPGPRARASGSGWSHRTPLLSTSGRVWGGVVLTAPPHSSAPPPAGVLRPLPPWSEACTPFLVHICHLLCLSSAAILTRNKCIKFK